MSWQRRLWDIAVAGGLASCASNAVISSGGTTSSGSGETGFSGTPTTGFGGSPIPPCNANPDPCCPCSYTHYGHGGYGGASCVDQTIYFVGDAGVSCASELACAAAPTAACCNGPGSFGVFGAASQACADAGLIGAGTGGHPADAGGG
jgi:hypothetical protein